LLNLVQWLRWWLWSLRVGGALGRLSGVRLRPTGSELAVLHSLLPSLQLVELPVIALAAQDTGARSVRDVCLHPRRCLVLLAVLAIILVIPTTTVASVAPSSTLRLRLTVLRVPPVLVPIPTARSVVVTRTVRTRPPVATLTATLASALPVTVAILVSATVAVTVAVMIAVAARGQALVPLAIVPPVAIVVVSSLPLPIPRSTGGLVAVLPPVIAVTVPVSATAVSALPTVPLRFAFAVFAAVLVPPSGRRVATRAWSVPSFRARTFAIVAVIRVW
jgi:hypothetical protein